MLRRVRLDAAGIQALRSMLVAEMGSVVQRMADPLVVEEAAKRVASGRWTLSVVDAPKISATGTQGGDQPGGGSQAKNGRIAILQFHGAPDVEHPWVHTPPERFAEYMKYLHDERFKAIAVRDLAKYVDWAQKPADPWKIIDQRKSELARPRTPRQVRREPS